MITWIQIWYMSDFTRLPLLIQIFNTKLFEIRCFMSIYLFIHYLHQQTKHAIYFNIIAWCFFLLSIWILFGLLNWKLFQLYPNPLNLYHTNLFSKFFIALGDKSSPSLYFNTSSFIFARIRVHNLLMIFVFLFFHICSKGTET